MSDRTCSIESCTKPARARGWCVGHYTRWRRGVDDMHAPFTGDLWSKVDKTSSPDGCWLWLASRVRGGYGQITWNGRGGHIAHRVIYELLVGRVPDGLELDHLCRVRHCVNPDHLEPVTHEENMARASKVRRISTPPRSAQD